MSKQRRQKIEELRAELKALEDLERQDAGLSTAMDIALSNPTIEIQIKGLPRPLIFPSDAFRQAVEIAKARNSIETDEKVRGRK